VPWPQPAIDVLDNLAGHARSLSPRGVLVNELLTIVVNVRNVVMRIEEILWYAFKTRKISVGFRLEPTRNDLVVNGLFWCVEYAAQHLTANSAPAIVPHWGRPFPIMLFCRH
jgi:hypothetical protein